jgi:hypothetical protein
MSDLIPSLTPEQLEVYKTLQRVRMAWLTLYVTLGCFIADFIALCIAAFSTTAGWEMRFAFGMIDALLAYGLNPIFHHLFPVPNRSSEDK